MCLLKRRNGQRLLSNAAFLLIIAGFMLVGCDDDVKSVTTNGKKHTNVDPLAVVGRNEYPVRLAEDSRGRIYVSDFKSRSVFVYDRQLKLRGEYKRMRSPLGVAVTDRYLLVGNALDRRVDAYDLNSAKWQFSLGGGEIQAPNDLALDAVGQLYIADCKSNRVSVFDIQRRQLIRSIGAKGTADGEFQFPSAVAIGRRYDSNRQVEAEELYVADQGNKRIQVFDLYGNFLRSFSPGTGGLGFGLMGGMMDGNRAAGKGEVIGAGAAMPMGMGSMYDDGKILQRVQSLAVDEFGQVHALDCYTHRVEVLDAVTGGLLEQYGEYGSGPAQMLVPLDILITNRGAVIVANTYNHRVEFLRGDRQ